MLPPGGLGEGDFSLGFPLGVRLFVGGLMRPATLVGDLGGDQFSTISSSGVGLPDRDCLRLLAVLSVLPVMPSVPGYVLSFSFNAVFWNMSCWICSFCCLGLFAGSS